MHPANAIAAICYRADRLTRNDLAEGTVVSERDYMSALSVRIRDAWKPLGKAYAYSKTLPGDAEQTFGCDTLIVIHDDVGAKICLLEAKWPRVVSKPAHKWDHLQREKGKSGKVSHFSSQIGRQRLALPDAFVGEMFLCESFPGTPSSLLDEYGSTIVSHKQALSYDLTRRNSAAIWSNIDFWELIGYAGKRKLNLGRLVYGLASCEIGAPLPIAGGEVTVGAVGDLPTINIPTSLDRLDQLVPELCARIGISTFLSLNIRWIGWR
jgi:hypothetical protein